VHPWISSNEKVPLDILVYRLVRNYLRSSSMKRAALKALSKTLMEEDLVYLRAQFLFLEPNKNGRVTFENFRTVHFQTCHYPYLFFPFQELLFKQLLRVFLRVLAAQNVCILISAQLGSLESILCLIINRNGLYPKTLNRYLELGRCFYKLFKS
jgi:hypothetical protein